jgi:hypothetical protein
MQQDRQQQMQSGESGTSDPYRSVVTQWLEEDYYKFTEAVIRALMIDRRETT